MSRSTPSANATTFTDPAHVEIDALRERHNTEPAQVDMDALRERHNRLVRAHTTPQHIAQRARIVLTNAEGRLHVEQADLTAGE